MRRDDPITNEQVQILSEILNEEITGQLLEGFLIMCSRLVDNFGHHRTNELRNIFQTHKKEGVACLKRSLLELSNVLKSYKDFTALYPVSINPPNPAFPMLKMIGIENIVDHVYRVLDSNSRIRGTDELVSEYIMRTGQLPFAPPPSAPVLREKPKFVHWCSYLTFATPSETQDALQILPEWSNCRLRATLPVATIREHAYMAYNGDHHDPKNKVFGFYGYFFEPLTQDHPPLLGGCVQIKVFGSPNVTVLEKWCEEKNRWYTVWCQ
ncbi:hypothetical protein [Glaciecola sp. 1036]|uniref:hypothetical protein n=1 Tax=Alteromonadaceae TaxID=72275 RepID=UPI003D064A66